MNKSEIGLKDYEELIYEIISKKSKIGDLPK